jgi:hypothetical protein
MPLRWIAPLCAYLALMFAAGVAFARDDVPWGDVPPEISAWFRSLKMPDNAAVSCCGLADAYEADDFQIEGDHYVAIITDGRADPAHGKPAIPNGTRIPVPNHKMKWDAGNPTGHGVLFLGPPPIDSPDDHLKRPVYCYVTPGGI